MCCEGLMTGGLNSQTSLVASLAAIALASRYTPFSKLHPAGGAA